MDPTQKEGHRKLMEAINQERRKSQSSAASRTASFESTQQQTINIMFWVNEVLEPHNLHVDDIKKDFSDGTKLIKLLEAVSNRAVAPPTQKRAAHSTFRAIYAREQISIALTFMVENGLMSKSHHIGPEDIYSGNVKMILAVLKMIQRYAIDLETSTHTAVRQSSSAHDLSHVHGEDSDDHRGTKSEEETSERMPLDDHHEASTAMTEAERPPPLSSSSQIERILSIEDDESRSTPLVLSSSPATHATATEREENPSGFNSEVTVDHTDHHVTSPRKEKKEKKEKKKKKEKKDKSDDKKRRSSRRQQSLNNLMEETASIPTPASPASPASPAIKENVIEEPASPAVPIRDLSVTTLEGYETVSPPTSPMVSPIMSPALSPMASPNGSRPTSPMISPSPSQEMLIRDSSSSSIKQEKEDGATPTCLSGEERIAHDPIDLDVKFDHPFFQNLSDISGSDDASDDDIQLRKPRSEQKKIEKKKRQSKHVSVNELMAPTPLPSTPDNPIARPAVTEDIAHKSKKKFPIPFSTMRKHKDKSSEKIETVPGTSAKSPTSSRERGATLHVEKKRDSFRESSRNSVEDSRERGKTLPHNMSMPNVDTSSHDLKTPGSPKAPDRLSQSADALSPPVNRPVTLYDGVPPLKIMTNRDWAAREIYTSEIQYQQHLDLIVLTYMPNLREMCSAEEMKTLFSNIQILRNYSAQLLQRLEARMISWSAVENLGDIFIFFHPFFKSYKDYCNKYNAAIECYTECMKRPNFKAFCMKELEKTPKGLGPDLQSLLVTPVQRIPRYMLLLMHLLALTPPTHPDFSALTTALAKMKEITDVVNFSIKETDKSKLYNRIVETVQGIKPHMAPHRKFIAEGNVYVITNEFVDDAETVSMVRTQSWLELFSQVLFLVSGTSLEERSVDHVLPVASIWLQDFSGEGANRFMMVCPEKTFMIQCSSYEEKKRWVEMIQEEINAVYKEDMSGKPLRRFKHRFASGESYEGQWKSAKMHGKGRYTFPSGKIYDGDFEEGCLEGKGVLKFSESKIYRGHFKTGVPHGVGVLTMPNCEYGGYWKNGQKAKGILSWNNGDSYKGRFKKDLFEGKGTYTFANGDSYKGLWRAGQRYGKGVFISVLGTYDGEWREDKRHGEGHMTYADGATYSGQWTNDMRNGIGVYTTPQMSYTGSWLDDRREGKGTLVALAPPVPHSRAEADIRFKYEGDWKADERNGHGVLTMPKGIRYDGHWLAGLRDGKGDYSDPSGTYAGTWKSDEWNGSGAFISADKKSAYKGKWQGGLGVGAGERVYLNRAGKHKTEKVQNGKLKVDPTGLNSAPPQMPSIRILT